MSHEVEGRREQREASVHRLRDVIEAKRHGDHARDRDEVPCEFQPKELVPGSIAVSDTAGWIESSPQLRAGLDGVIDSLLAAQHVLEIFRRPLPKGTSRTCLDRLSNRLTKILSEARKLRTP